MPSTLASKTLVAIGAGGFALGLFQGTASADPMVTGNTAAVTVDAPVTICGNAVGLLDPASASCSGGPAPAPAPAPSDSGVVGAAIGSGTPSTAGAPASGPGTGLIDGNVVGIGIEAPVTVCGNAVAALDPAAASCAPGASSALTSSGATTGPGIGTLAGTTATGEVAAPVTVCGNSVGALASASAGCATASDQASDQPSSPPSNVTNPSDSIGSIGSLPTATGEVGADVRSALASLPTTGVSAGLLALLGVALAGTGRVLSRVSARR